MDSLSADAITCPSRQQWLATNTRKPSIPGVGTSRFPALEDGNGLGNPRYSPDRDQLVSVVTYLRCPWSDAVRPVAIVRSLNGGERTNDWCNFSTVTT